MLIEASPGLVPTAAAGTANVLRTVEVEARRAGSLALFARRSHVVEALGLDGRCGPGRDCLPGEVVLVPRDPADDGELVVRVTGTLTDGCSVVQEARVRFEPNRTLWLAMELAASCVQNDCAASPGTTCLRGLCRPRSEIRALGQPPTRSDGGAPPADITTCGDVDDRPDVGAEQPPDRVAPPDATDGSPLVCPSDAEGRSCPLPHATGRCTAGACTLFEASCERGFADCDASQANGCETPVAADDMNCGGCGVRCTRPNAAARCAAGACVLGACVPGFGDCDGNEANGCETRTDADPSHCGACRRVCELPEATSYVCRGGVCAAATCAGFLGDCDGNPANGCETDNATSAAHCGRCGARCAPANASPRCLRGECHLGDCRAGFNDCDRNDADGCESQADRDPMNCGECGRVCALPHVTVPACAGGACGVGACEPGFADCDTTAANGCETAVGADSNHCGGCGHACGLRQYCVAGACASVFRTPRQLAPLSVRTVTTRRPTFRWLLGADGSGGRVEVCRDRACATVVASLTGSRAASPTADLPLGVLYWRVFWRRGGDEDPAPSPTWEFRVTSRAGAAGTSWGLAPDLNRDGYADLIVGAPVADPGGRVDAGEASIHLGGATGPSPSPLRVLEGVASNDRFGLVVAGAGDVNGDGYSDFAVGAPRARAGEVTVYLGGPEGIVAAAPLVLRGDAMGDSFGSVVVSAGDVNGDGYDELAVAAPNARSVMVYPGGPAGLSATPVRLTPAVVTDEGFGYAVAGLGDTNGDGYDDLAVAAPGGAAGGAVIIYLGGAMGLARSLRLPSAGVAGDGFGESAAGVGDVNGDGYDDLAIAAPLTSASSRTRAGAVWIHPGTASGPSLVPSQTLSGRAFEELGRFVGAAGDLNGDGYADLAAGSLRGDIALHAGGAGGLSVSPGQVLEGAGSLPRAAGSGDLDGDGYADFAAGVPGTSVTIYQGSTIGLLTAPPLQVLRGRAVGDAFGWSVAEFVAVQRGTRLVVERRAGGLRPTPRGRRAF